MFNVLICTLGVMLFVLATVAAISLGAGKHVHIIPEFQRGTGHSSVPAYIEWDGTYLIHHSTGSRTVVGLGPDLDKFDGFQEAYDHIDGRISRTRLKTVFDRVIQHRREKYILVLVRPAGFSTFILIRGYIESKGIDIGYEPIDESWLFSLPKGGTDG